MAHEALQMWRSAAKRVNPTVAAAAVVLATFAPAALSYVGPGAGIGMIASLVAIVLAVLATIVGLVLWPIRKFLRRKKPASTELEQPKPDDGV